MIILNKSQEVNQIAVTVSRDKINSETGLILLLHSSTNNRHAIILSDNLSPWPDRYDLFNIPVQQFASLNESIYQYSIDEYNVETGESVYTLEVGLLKIANGEPLAYLSTDIYEPSTDQFKVYQGI